MRHPVYKVKGVEVVGPHRLRIEFTDGLVRTIDFRSILEGEVYARWAAAARGLIQAVQRAFRFA